MTGCCLCGDLLYGKPCMRDAFCEVWSSSWYRVHACCDFGILQGIYVLLSKLTMRQIHIVSYSSHSFANIIKMSSLSKPRPHGPTGFKLKPGKYIQSGSDPTLSNVRRTAHPSPPHALDHDLRLRESAAPSVRHLVQRGCHFEASHTVALRPSRTGPFTAVSTPAGPYEAEQARLDRKGAAEIGRMAHDAGETGGVGVPCGTAAEPGREDGFELRGCGVEGGGVGRCVTGLERDVEQVASQYAMLRVGVVENWDVLINILCLNQGGDGGDRLEGLSLCRTYLASLSCAGPEAPHCWRL